MFVSEDAHYSNMRPGICLGAYLTFGKNNFDLQISGIGMNNVVAIKSDSRGAMCVVDLRKRIEVSSFTSFEISTELCAISKWKKRLISWSDNG